ncbi:MAG: ribonuclease III [Aquihabitans sp.]
MSETRTSTPVLRSSSGLEFPIPADKLARFIEQLGHDFVDPGLLGCSLTHRSWCAEHAGFESNERLEFLGDSVLGVIVSAYLFRSHPDAGEGQLSLIRASVVCSTALAEMAADLGLGEVLLLGKGEAASGGRERPSILADGMEAVIGAVFLDGGIAAARKLVLSMVEPRLEDAGVPDHKSRLHERVAQEHDRQIRYEITDAGPEHDKTFRAVVLLDEAPFGVGSGRSKKQAEQAAAREAWLLLDTQDGASSPARDGDRPAREDSDG